MNVEIFGMEGRSEWNKIFTVPDRDIDLGVVAEEAVRTAQDAVREFPDIGVMVLECTDLPPFTDAIRRATGLPVYDFTTMVGLVARSLGLEAL
jgi:hypothetical protein